MSAERPTRMANCQWPLRRIARGWARATMQERGHAALRHLVRTQLGSISWAPTYGWVAEEIRTQGLVDDEMDAYVEELRQAAAEWIPWLVVTDVRFTLRPDEKETLEVHVGWFVPSQTSGILVSSAGPYETTVLV